MDVLYSDWQPVFTVLQSESVPGINSEELANRISTATKHSLNTLMQSTQSVRREDSDLICLCLTVIGKVIASQSSKSLSQNVKVYYEDVIKRLFVDISLISDLVHFLDFQDRLLSHLTAKCLSSFVIYDICTRCESNAVWTGTLVKTFKESGLGYKLDTCLWSLTHVIKGILRGCCLSKQEILMKLLVGFEPSLHSLYSKLLGHATSEHKKTAPCVADSSDLDVTVCAFMDLLEALTAARMKHGVCSSIQRLPFLQSPALLHLIDSEAEYFAKKRVLLLLKRCLVQKAGEEWASEDGHASLVDDESWSSDVLAMADAVLQEVDSGWLRRMSVKPRASFFGGNREVCPDGEGKDAVMLRAVSLILIKCLERKLQHVSTAEASHAVNVQQYTRELLVFLQQQQVFQDQTDTHSCSWISLVFGEQDDDLMESIKALTALYLYQKRLGSSDPEACNWGCNPHCHFILLLQSLFFDHTVLLDFLISAETCFLEYCVLYLKHLPETWQEFCNACSRIEDSERKFGGCDAEAPPLPAVPETSVNLQRTSFTPHPKTDPQSITSQRPGRDHPVVCSLPRLVDYESSEGSEEDEQNGLNLQMKGIPKELVANSGMRRVKRTPRSADSAEKMRANSSVSLVRKVVLCLAELSGVIARLHARGLYPYNPSSLLKLLKAVEAQGNL